MVHEPEYLQMEFTSILDVEYNKTSRDIGARDKSESS